MPQVLVVVGAGGMGEAIARRSGAGHRVVLADFDPKTLDNVAERLRGDGFDVVTEPVDVADQVSVRALADKAARLGAVTKVAHTAGLSPVQAPVRAILSVDLAGVAHSLDAFGEVVADGGAGVVIASMAGTMIAPHLPAEQEAALIATPSDRLLALPFLADGALTDPGHAYAIAKRANQLRVHAAALAWGSRGARVNTISPGVVSTAMGQAELRGESGATMRSMVARSGTGRLGTPSDIAGAAAFLLGPDSTFITGTDLLVDGGVVAGLRSAAVDPPHS